MKNLKGLITVTITLVVLGAFVYWVFFVFSPDSGCIQVIQRARNPITKEVRDFPTPCAVPIGWDRINH
jgi:hypothetical protein